MARGRARRPARAARGIADLFRGDVRRTAVLMILVCSLSLTAHWAFMFWYQQHLRNLPDLVGLDAEREERAGERGDVRWSWSASIVGNFLAAGAGPPARLPPGDRAAVPGLLPGDGRDLRRPPRATPALMVLLPVIGVFSGLFALFTMYLPPLFPTLLRTTGAGFCYNIGRIAAAVGTVVFGLLSTVRRLPDGPALRRLPVPARRAARPGPAGPGRPGPPDRSRSSSSFERIDI